MCSILPTELCVKIHNFAHELFDYFLAGGAVLAACQFCNCLCDCANRLIGLNGAWLTGCCWVLSEKLVEELDNHTVKARSVFVRLLF
jgi:hypothetical protein